LLLGGEEGGAEGEDDTDERSQGDDETERTTGADTKRVEDRSERDRRGESMVGRKGCLRATRATREAERDAGRVTQTTMSGASRKIITYPKIDLSQYLSNQTTDPNQVF
jgi:hypothetical protein